MLGIVNGVIVVGALITAAGGVLLADLAGAGGYAMRHVTTKPLGSLAPGYAASKHGFQVYSLLVLAIGLVFLGLGLAASAVTSGVALLGIGLVAFAFSTVFAIRGEVQTYRALKR